MEDKGWINYKKRWMNILKKRLYNMQYCTRCLYPSNHPLNITFDRDGVCSGCRIHEEKDTINWVEREGKLKKILDEFKNKDGNSYDCIIPVSGGKFRLRHFEQPRQTAANSAFYSFQILV